jgi:hypothetical protein
MNQASRSPQARALHCCLDVLIRMDPDAVKVARLKPCTDSEFNAAVARAASVIYGPQRTAWPIEVQAVLQRR